MIGSLVNVPVGSMSNLAMLSHEWANCNEGLCSYGNIIFSIKIRNIHIFLVSFSLRLKMFVPRISFNSLLWTIYFRKLKIFTKKLNWGVVSASTSFTYLFLINIWIFSFHPWARRMMTDKCDAGDIWRLLWTIMVIQMTKWSKYTLQWGHKFTLHFKYIGDSEEITLLSALGWYWAHVSFYIFTVFTPFKLQDPFCF